MKRLIPILICALAVASCAGRASKRSQRATIVTPERYTYEVVATYPHLTTSYTQGLQFVDGELWEGTGGYGTSQLLRVAADGSKVEVVAELPKREFGEGITLLGERIYQLTWQNGLMHIYDRATLREVATHSYRGEGWGLTSDGKWLYMSDGTSDIRVIDPATLREERRFNVRLRGESLGYLNELEWIDGRIWANVYTLDQIVIINPESGDVEGVIDLSGLLPAEDVTPTTDVLNGIAWDEQTGRIFVTGKNWNKMFEIRVIAL